MLRLAGTASTHVGQVRKTNQDRALFSPPLGAVADGMGGHRGGEQAAAITIDTFRQVSDPMTRDRLLETVRAANKAVYDEGERPELRGMGTTVVAAVLQPEERRLTMVNVGDSRGYRFRDGELEQITVDHSLVEELVQQGRISAEDAWSHPQRNIVTRALGLAAEVEIDVFELDAAHGDRLLLCSDGLSNEVSVEAISERLRDVVDPELAAQELVELALAGGGRDNISVVVLDVIDDEDPTAIRSAAESTTRPTPKAAATAFDTTQMNEVDENTGDGALQVEAPPIDGGVETDTPAQVVDHSPTTRRSSVLQGQRQRERSRAGLLGVAVIATFLVAFLGISWFASNAYFAAEDGGEVVIFKGRPGGILWIDPEVEERTGLFVDELTPAGIQKLEQELEWTSLGDASDFVDQLERVTASESEN